MGFGFSLFSAIDVVLRGSKCTHSVSYVPTGLLVRSKRKGRGPDDLYN